MIARLIALLVVALVCCRVAGASPAYRAEPFTMTTTLDGRRVLPVRTRWIASTSLPAAEVRRVAFLIDGRVRWLSTRPPFNYGSPDGGDETGFLITTWLSPGTHRFVARATAVNGTTASATTIARVQRSPDPPRELRGRWMRIVSQSDLAKSDPRWGGSPPPGRWTLIFDHIGLYHLGPGGGGVVDEFTAARHTLEVFAPIQQSPFVGGHSGTRRFGGEIGGDDCSFAGPFGTYRRRVEGRSLVLSAFREGCGQRRAILDGRWRRP